MLISAFRILVKKVNMVQFYWSMCNQLLKNVKAKMLFSIQFFFFLVSLTCVPDDPFYNYEDMIYFYKSLLWSNLVTNRTEYSQQFFFKHDSIQNINEKHLKYYWYTSKLIMFNKNS
jgi:hypothetical protein